MNGKLQDVNFNWIQNSTIKHFDQVKPSKTNNEVSDLLQGKSSKTNNQVNDLLHNLKCKTSNLGPGEKVTIHTTVLSKTDIMCLEYYEQKASDENFLWYLNYLSEKQARSQHTFLKSCLVPKSDYTLPHEKVSEEVDVGKKHNFTINIRESG